MNKTIVGALMIVVLVAVGAVGLKLLLPVIEESQQKATTDAAKTRGKIRIALDNWAGYFILNSPEMEKAMHKAGYLLICEDDNADYAQRMKRLDDGEIDFAAATVDSFILNAAPHHFPGAIVMVIDESKGGDAILARKDRITSLDDLKGKTGVKVAFTPSSPSHYLAKAASYHFDAPELLPAGNLLIETDGSEKAREKLLAGRTDVAICWEPDVSRALEKDEIIKILGTEDTERLIVDILVASRDVLKKKPEIVKLLLGNYFRTLKKYRDDPDLLRKDVKDQTHLPEKAVMSMLKGVRWVNFTENCETWFGIASPGGYADEGLMDAIGATVRILKNAGDFSTSPIPDEDPHRLINSGFLEEMYTSGITGFKKPGAHGKTSGPVNSLAARFERLDDDAWDRLKEVGALKMEPIVFQQGAANLDSLAEKVVDQAVERLKHYPNFRIVIKGHTGVRGDKQENINLSRGRADAVARYLIKTYKVDPNRQRVIGYGGAKPLPKLPGESRRAWMYRLPRVELVLAREDF
ncbi:MAG: OmpA family protein [Desulfobacterales bacterium]|nr:OmpA family protein [Desulfobacterales bacterium]